MSDEEMKTCGQCLWMYHPLNANDTGFCGPCSRELGLSPRNAETDELDARIRIVQAEHKAERLAR